MNVILQNTAATSGTITATDTQQDLVIIHDASTTLTLTIAFPSTPTNSQMFTIASVGGVTTLSLTAVVGAISNALTTISAGGNATYMYSSSVNKWVKIK